MRFVSGWGWCGWNCQFSGVKSAGLSLGLLDACVHAFDFFALHQSECLLEAVASYGGEGEVGEYVDASEVVASESCFFAEEACDVGAAQAVAFSFADVEGGPLGLWDGGRGGGQVGCGDVRGEPVGSCFGGVEDEVGGASCVPAGCASVAVCEGVGLCGEVVVDDVLHAVDVQSAGGEVGADEDGCGAVAEFVEGAFAVVLFHAAVEGGGGEASFAEVAGDAFDAFAVVGEDEGGAGAQCAEEAEEGFELVFVGGGDDAQGQAVVCVGGGQEVEAQGCGVGVLCGADEVGEGGGVGGGEEHAASDGREEADDFFHFFLEAELEAFVKFVDDEGVDVAGVEVAFAQVVGQASGCGYDECGVCLAHQAVLVHGGPSSVAAQGAQGCLHVGEHAGGLLGQFARGGEDEGLHAGGVFAQFGGQGEEEGQCLAGACGGEQDEVAPGGPGLCRGFLHGGEGGDVQAGEYVGVLHSGGVWCFGRKDTFFRGESGWEAGGISQKRPRVIFSGRNVFFLQKIRNFAPGIESPPPSSPVPVSSPVFLVLSSIDIVEKARADLWKICAGFFLVKRANLKAKHLLF